MQKAMALHQAGEWTEAARCYRAILAGDPSQFEALHYFGMLEAQQGHNDDALALIVRALKVNPRSVDAHTNHANVLRALNRSDDALASCDLALTIDPASALAHYNRGNILLDLQRDADALASFDRALALMPDNAAALYNRGTALQNLRRHEDALASYDRVVALIPDNASAHYNRGVSLQELKRYAEALLSYDRALAIAPDDADVLTNRGIVLYELKRYEQALASYDRALAVRPDLVEALNNRSNVLREMGRAVDALASCDRALAIKPDYAEALNNRGIAQLALDRHDEALASFDRALAITPDYAEALGNRGNALRELNRLEEALASCERALAIKPDFAEAHNNLGYVLVGQGRLEEAVASYRAALSFRPDFAEAHNNLGNALKGQGRLDEAVAGFQRALTLKPDYVEARSNLGVALMEQDKLDDAITSFRQALASRPDYAEAHNNLGNALRDQGRLDEAIASFNQALAIKPDFAIPHNNLGNALRDQGKLDEAVASYRMALSLKPDDAETHSNLLYALQFYPDEAPSEILAAARRFAARFEAPLQTGWQPHQNPREAGRRLKVGYVSPDFRRHAVAFFIEPILANHDKEQVEVFCYYNHTQHDEFTERLTGYADHWLACKGMTDAQLAARIRSDGIDILVDLAGHTAHNRMLTFARKPAPLQITYLGYPGTSGLAAMDYRLTDDSADPAGSETRYSEKLLRLPDSLWCFRPVENMPEISALPAQRNGHITFGSFNNFNKIDRPCIELWAQLLRALPGSRLLMVTVPEGAARLRLAEQFAALGVAAERLEFHGKLPGGEFHRMLQRVDLTLDPVSVNGATTTCESLWLGAPVLTLTGTRFLSRAGFSILNAAGLREFAAASAASYIEIAQRLAADVDGLAALRAGLRTQVAQSPLVDETRFTRNLEKLFRNIWTQWCGSTK